MDPLVASLKISASGLEAQSSRLRVVSENLANARSTGDTAKQAEYYKELQKKLVDMQSDVFLLTQNVQHAMDKCLTGFNAVPMQSFDYDFTRYSWTCK